MGKRHWDEIDEQMEREGQAVRESMRSIAQTRKSTVQGEAKPKTDDALDRLLGRTRRN